MSDQDQTSLNVAIGTTPSSAVIPSSPSQSPYRAPEYLQPKPPVSNSAPASIPAADGKRDPLADLLNRFNTHYAPFEEDGKTPKPTRLAFQNMGGFVGLETNPESRLRFGIQGGIHTYVIVRNRNGNLVAQLYGMIPAAYNNFIVPFLEGAGVKIDTTPFIRPSGI